MPSICRSMPPPEKMPRPTPCESSRRVSPRSVRHDPSASTAAASPKRTTSETAARNQVSAPGSRRVCARYSAFDRGKLRPHSAVANSSQPMARARCGAVPGASGRGERLVGGQRRMRVGMLLGTRGHGKKRGGESRVEGSRAANRVLSFGETLIKIASRAGLALTTRGRTPPDKFRRFLHASPFLPA